ncbi:aarF domain-containing kinase [Angomonas deanei]|uniref:ABC1 family, putative n=1 Tax=Angomonas deanei TaxID=59799 RepID=A0A7G2CHG2_9TRYP|nr:aarF domain-containing kinase [Angomonas deanei]CAD2219290.1 ABC1 family, putative [Angomonas deanei]|eukprot:EPY34940.1 aarF domain-containing kinase [Angomonas deanei]
MDGVPSGTELAIKVTHPNIRRQIKADLLAMETVICIGNKIIPGLKFLNLDKSVLEFSSLLRSQLNLLVECDNFQQFRYNFRDIKGILFPTPLPSLCSQDVLFETFEEGEPLQNIACSSDNTDLAELGCHMFLKMLFQDNFVHSDLHPGNVLIRENWSLEEDLGNRRSILDPKRKERMNDMRDEKSLTERYYPDGRRKLRRELVVLDAGLVTTLSPQERNNFISLFAAVACGDGKLGADLMIDRLPETMRQDDDDHRDKNKNNKGASTNTVDREAFRKSMTEVFDLVAPTKEGFKLSQIRIGYVLSKILKVVREHNAPLDGNFASLVLTVMVGEDLDETHPDFNIFAEAAPVHDCVPTR